VDQNSISDQRNFMSKLRKMN